MSYTEQQALEEAKVTFSEGHDRHQPAEFPDLCVRCAEEEGKAVCATCARLLTTAEEDEDGCCDTLFCNPCFWNHLQEEHHPLNEEEEDDD